MNTKLLVASYISALAILFMPLDGHAEGAIMALETPGLILPIIFTIIIKGNDPRTLGSSMILLGWSFRAWQTYQVLPTLPTHTPAESLFHFLMFMQFIATLFFLLLFVLDPLLQKKA